MLFRPLFRRPVAGSFALIALAATAATAEGTDITVIDAKIAGGKLVISGTTATPNTWVRLDGQTGSAFNVKSEADGIFSFKIVYRPGDCIVALQKLIAPSMLGVATNALVGDCGSGIVPRGAWNGAVNYQTNDLVASLGSSWIALHDNVKKPPATSALDWALFAAGAAGPAGPQGLAGAAGPTGPQGPAGPDFASLAPPSGPAGGDLAGTYPNPTIKPLAITASKIAVGAVTTPRIALGAITAPRIALGAVLGNRIADGAVTSTKVLDDTVAGGGLAAADLAANSVSSSEIQTDAVQATEIANDSIDSGEIVDFGLSNQDIGVLFAQVNANGTLANSSGSVTSSRLGAGTYEVDFGHIVSSCAAVMTQGEAGIGGAGGAITGVTDRASNAEAFFVTTRTDANVLADRAFQLVVVC